MFACNSSILQLRWLIILISSYFEQSANILKAEFLQRATLSLQYTQLKTGHCICFHFLFTSRWHAVELYSTKIELTFSSGMLKFTGRN